MNHASFVSHFEKSDPTIAALLLKFGEYEIPQRGDYYNALIRSIVGQQVSVKAAQSVFEKLEARYNGILDPGILAQSTQEELRECGISRQKYSYIVDLSDKFMNQTELFEDLVNMQDEEVITALTSVKGIGVWTAQMFLMFTLARLDVFPVDDLAIRTAMAKQFGFKRDEVKRAKYHKLSEPWAPYRSVACWYLWKSLH
jgi:DNA-3-methyladenine glycosylase II